MNESLNSWVQENCLSLKTTEKENIFTIEGVGKFLLLSPKYFQIISKKANDIIEVTEQDYNQLDKSYRQIRILDKDFSLILNDKEYDEASNVDYLLFKFGSKYFYTDKIEKPELIEFKYLGKVNTILDQPNIPFIGVHGGYELCDGSRRYEYWCQKANFLNCSILGLCEENTLAGVIPFQKACKKYNIKSIIGETVVVKNSQGIYRVNLYCKDKEYGWKNLLVINKEILVSNSGFIDESVLLTLGKGLICLLNNDISLKLIYDLYNQSDFELYYKLDLSEWSAQNREEQALINTQEYLTDYLTELLPVLGNDAYYLDKQDSYIRKVLNKIGKSNFKSQSKFQFFKNIDDYAAEITELIPDSSKALMLLDLVVENTQEVFKEEYCFDIITGQIYFPKYVMTEDEASKFSTNEELLLDYINKGLEKNVINKGKKDELPKYLERINEELEVLKLGGFIDYFLILADIYRYCDENNIWYGVGRGSAAGSMVAYLGGVTGIDPFQFNLLFERFLNRGRVEKGGSAPDIDCDFQTSRRSDVKKYIEEKYGHDQVVSIGTFGTFKLRNALKDVGRIYGVDSTLINFISPHLPDPEQQRPQPYNDLFLAASGNSSQNKMVYEFVQKYPKVVETLPLLFNQPKNTSIHAAGVIIAPKEYGTVFEQTPVKVIDGVLVSEWEGQYIDEAGLLKLDILGLQQLDKFSSIFDLIKEMTGEVVRFNNISLDDTKVFDLFKEGYNEDVFQLGATGLKNYCKKLQPEKIEDLIATVALYRPGPIESGTHIKYVKIKNGEEELSPYSGTEEITKPTYGLIVYQEQVMQICQHVADFSLSEADDVRKALGKMKPDIIAEYKDVFLSRAVKKGYNKQEMEELWLEMERFAAYAFNKCISGDESLYRASHNKSGKSSFYPTIREMYLIKNDAKYAKETKHESLHDRYRGSYGHSFSLNEDNRLIKNNIVDIYYAGEKEIYRMTLKSGETFDGTLNHKFPTSNGIKTLEEIDIKVDKIFVNEGHRSKISWVKLGSGKDNFPVEGQQGFRTKGITPHKELTDIEVQKTDYCEDCRKSNCRIETHHKDRDRTNNKRENISFLCSSCHKKDEYKLGRTKMGESGLHTRLESIKSIKFLKVGDVYDVEMEAPYHTFVTKNNIVTSNSHAAAYAITGYYSQWYKVHYPLQFWTVSLKYATTNAKGRDQRVDRVTEILNTTSIKVKSVDINYSDIEFTCNSEQNSIFWSLVSVKYVGEKIIETIITERTENGIFYSLEEFYDRVKGKPGINTRSITNLIVSGAFDQVVGIDYIEQRLIVLQDFFSHINQEMKEEWVQAESWKEYEWVLKQKELTGFGIIDFRKIVYNNEEFVSKSHKYKDNKTFLFHTELQEKESQEFVTCGILEEVRERSSRNGEFAQIMLTDNSESIFVTVWNETYKDYKEELLNSKGKVVILNANLLFDNYKQCNVFHTSRTTKISVL